MSTRFPRRPVLAASLAVTGIALSGCALLPGFNGGIYDQQRDAAANAQAELDLYNAAVAAWSYAVENNGYLPTTAADLYDFGYSPSQGVSEVRILADNSGLKLCLDITSAAGTRLKLINDDTVVEGTCSNADLS